MSESNKLPTLAEWEKGHDASPVCPKCGWYLGMRRAAFSANRRNAWTCERCGEEYDAGSDI